nr:unnamed protein product [Callosobruchus chinensis]
MWRILRMSSKSCYLVQIGTEKKFSLPHQQVKTIGRNIESEVKDLYVSKQQIELCADYDKCNLKVKPVGRAVCGIDGYAIVKDKTYTVGHGHVIELRLGFHQYQVVFDPAPPVENNRDQSDINQEEEAVPVTKKPKLDFPLFNSMNKKNIDKVDAVGNGKWESIDRKELLIYTPGEIQASSKVAAFDIDGTIIKTKSGAKFPKDFNDWVFFLSDIPQRLQKLSDDGYKIVFFTNQSGVGNNQVKVNEFKEKINNILKKISIPVQVLIATGKSIYRKPAPGMWNYLQNEKNDGIEINKKESFYVGDAAGRDKVPSRKYKDHSCVDRLFALNIGLKFYTPEEFFLKQKPEPHKMPGFDPKSLPGGRFPEANFSSPNVILMVGGPGSGKSHFCKNYLVPKGYVHVSRDKLGTWQKCVKQLEEALKNNKNVVVDNTNMDKESRARFVEVAKKYNADCRCFLMTTDISHSKHNNRFRELTDTTHVPVTDIIINSLKNSYQEPEQSEGFKDIIRVPFVPIFENEEHEKLYKLHLLEK